jgi:iron complex outermembrane receptor protein
VLPGERNIQRMFAESSSSAVRGACLYKNLGGFMKSATEKAPLRPRVRVLSEAVALAMGERSSRGPRPSPRSLKPALSALSGAAILGSALAIAPAPRVFAQDNADTGIEEITVTGSRIPRRDFTANAPIQTVDEQMFEDTTSIGVETVLNRLPQFVPAVTQFTTTDVQQTATNTVGVSTVSLRGLGPNRNLVLINGRRAMPVDPTMVVDTNSIPSAAIQRVEVISGGASAVYGADAVGGVVNFVLKDDFEGASIDVRVGDTQHGGNQEITINGLIGANVAGDRGNVMLGIERATRSKQYVWQRDWRVADLGNPSTGGGFFTFGSTTWFKNEQGTFGNNPSQDAVDDLFDQLDPGTISNNMAGFGSTAFRLNDDGTIFTGLQAGNSSAPGSYRFNGPVWNDGQSGDLDGDFAGLPVFVRQPNGNIKENNMYSWASSPLERLSAFANAHFDVSDNVRVTAQAMVTRTRTESSLGLTAANINQWGAAVPFGNEVYRGNDNSFFDVPDSLIDVNGDGVADAGDMTNPAYTIDGRFGVECDAQPTPEMPWLDGLPGCTKSEAWPTSAELYNLMMTRQNPEADIWASRPPDYLRHAIGGGRSTTNLTTTMNFSMGVEGELPSGNDFWDITFSTGRADNLVNQLGSVRLTSYRELFLYPNFGRNAVFDPNPYDDGFAESIPTCTTGLPIVQRFVPSKDCVTMISPALKNQREMTQSVVEANLVGDLAEMPAGPLQYALGLSYRENSFDFTPDNLSDNENQADPIAGLFPNERSFGQFDVTEIYGELLIPVVSDGPTGVEHFTFELGGRVSDWSMPQMPNLDTYKALIDWGFSPRYRLRGGFNRAFRAPNLGELFIARTQIFGGFGSRDWCSQNLDVPGGYSASAADPAQAAQSLAICQSLMGTTGASEYYTGRPLDEQPATGGTGVSNSYGNPLVREEQADTFTLGVVMDVADNTTLTVDYYSIELKNMIALEGADGTYQRCLDIAFNPSGDPNAPACQQIRRDPSTGGASSVDRSFDNEGRALMSGIDLQLNWSKMFANGGFNINSVANYNLEAITQDRPDLPEEDHAGYNDCGLQIQCQRYQYRVFNTFSYFRGPWSVSLRHQFWPKLDDDACREDRSSIDCQYDTLPSYSLFSLSGRFSFFDKYQVSLGIENLLDEAPPCTGADPTAFPFPTACTHGSGGSTYDPLGRRYFMSMTIDF